MNLNRDFRLRVVQYAADATWTPSPLPGVDRRMLDRVGAEVARAGLRREVLQQYAAQGGAHALIRPPDGRPFLVIGADHAQIGRRYRLPTLLHLCVFFISLGVAAFLWIM